MNICTTVCSNKLLSYPLCFAGGYVLNKLNTSVNQVVAKTFGWSNDLLEGKKYEEFAQDCLVKDSNGFGLPEDRILGKLLIANLLGAVRNEFSYRFVLEECVLPFIFPHLFLFKSGFSLAKTTLSACISAAHYLHHPETSKGRKISKFCRLAILGAISSIANQKIGFRGALLVHLGHNLFGFQYFYNRSFKDIGKALHAVNTDDINPSARFFYVVNGFVTDMLSHIGFLYQSVKNKVT